jgi:hypothetical protein
VVAAVVELPWPLPLPLPFDPADGASDSMVRAHARRIIIVVGAGDQHWWSRPTVTVI